MNKVVCNFSPYYYTDDKCTNRVYNLHIEDRTDPNVYARFELQIPTFEVIDSGRMNPDSQNEIVSFVKSHIDKIDKLMLRYQEYSMILADMVV